MTYAGIAINTGDLPLLREARWQDDLAIGPLGVTIPAALLARADKVLE